MLMWWHRSGRPIIEEVNEILNKNQEYNISFYDINTQPNINTINWLFNFTGGCPSESRAAVVRFVGDRSGAITGPRELV